MVQHFLDWLNRNNENKAIAGLVLLIIGAILKEIIPLFFSVIGKLILAFGKILGGRLGFRYFERLYLNWLVTELRELKLTGIASADASKKPKLEQVFVSLRVDGERGRPSPVQATIAVVEDMKRRRVVDYALIRELKKELEIATPALRKDAEQMLAGYMISSRKSITRFLAFLRSKAVPSDTVVIESVLSNLDDSSNSLTGSADYGAVLLRKMLRDEQRIAILGTPGAGKTTLLQYIGVAYARARSGDAKLREKGTYKSRLGARSWKVPIFVSLGSIAKKLVTPLPDGRQPSLLDLLVTTLPPDLQDPVATTYFTRQIKKGRCIVLLDGLDEVPNDEEFRAVVRAIEGLVIIGAHNQFVVTSRIAGWRTGVNADFKQFYVSDLTETQVSSFINTWYSAVELNAVLGKLEDEGETDRRNRERKASRQASDLQTVLKENPGLRQLSTNPMLLSIIALVHHSLATLPQERGKLYAECTKILLEQWDMSRGLRLDDTGLKLDQKETIMRRLAFALHTGEIGLEGGGREASRPEVVALLTSALPDFGRPSSEAGHLLQILVERSGIIVERQRDVLAFAHLTFQEYFAARHFAHGDRPENRAFLLSPERLHSDWWREVVLLYSGMLPDSSDFVRAVHKSGSDDLLRADLRLAGWCLGESVQVRQASVRSAVAQDLIRIRSRGNIASVSVEVPTEVIAYLIKWSKEEDWYSDALVHSIGEASSAEELEKARKLIISMLTSSQIPMIRAGIRAIRHAPSGVTNEAILDNIIMLLKHSEADIAPAAAMCLEHIWVDSASVPFKTAFRDAFRRGDVATTRGLMSLLRTKATSVIPAISAQLSEQLLTHVNWRIREEAAKLFVSLAPTAFASTIDAFFKLLYDDDSDVAGAARDTLRLVLRSFPRDTLVERTVALLKNSDPIARVAAINALAELDKETVIKHGIIEELATLLADKHDVVRASLVSTLTMLASKTLAPVVAKIALQSICDHGHAGRKCAIEVAAGLHPNTESSKIRELVIEQLNSRHSDVREAAVSAVAALKFAKLDDEVFQQLLDAADSRNFKIRAAAISTLGVVGGKHRREEILQLINSALGDKRSDVRNAAAEAAGRYGRFGRRFVDPLIAEISKRPKRGLIFRYAIPGKLYRAATVPWHEFDSMKYEKLFSALASIAEQVDTERVIAKLISLVPLTSSNPMLWQPLMYLFTAKMRPVGM